MVLLTTGFVFSQDCNLKFEGRVIDLYSEKPLKAAVIEVLGTNYNTISNNNGFFVLKNQCKNPITLKISHINCEDLFATINIEDSENQLFYLDHKIQALNEVVVAEKKVNSYNTTAKIYSLNELQKDRYSNKGLAGALEQITGVNTLSTGSNVAKPVIHGMFGSRVGIIYNGINLENQQWGQDHAPNIDISAFENIRLIKGASALRYSGSNPGGVVILESKLPKRTDSLYGKTIINGMTNGQGVNIVSSWVKSYKTGNYFKVQGTLKKIGDLSAPNYILSNSGVNEKNMSFTFGKNKTDNNWKIYFSYFNNEIGILKSAHVGNVGDLLRAIESNEPGVINPFSYAINYPKQKNNHLTSSIDFQKVFNSNSKLNLKYSFQKNKRKEFDLRIGSVRDVAALNLNLNTHNFNTNYHKNFPEGEIDSGLFFEIQDNFSTTGTGVKRLIPDYLKTRIGAYFTTSIKKYSGIDLGFGFRYEHNSNDVQKYYHNNLWNSENYEELLGQYVIDEVFNQKLVRRKIVFNTISFNTGISFELFDYYNLGIQYNFVQRAPDIAEMFSDGLHHALASIEYGNPFLKKETTNKISLDFDKNIGSFRYNISPFLIFGKNYIIVQPTGFEQTVRGAFPVWKYQPLNVIMRGFDFDLLYNLNDEITFSHNTSLVDGFENNTNTPLVSIPPLTMKNAIQFSIPSWKRFFIVLNSKNVFQQKSFPDNNLVTSIFENGSRVDKIVDISTPPPGYHDLGLDLNWGPYNLSNMKLNISLSFDNILNTSYRDYLNRLRFYADEMGRNIMLQIKIQH